MTLSVHNKKGQQFTTTTIQPLDFSKCEGNHSFIMDWETSEEICNKCGYVEIPSLRRAQLIVERQTHKLSDYADVIPPSTQTQIGMTPDLTTEIGCESGQTPVKYAMTATLLQPSVTINNNDPNDHKATKREFIIAKTTEVDFSCGGFLSTKIDTRNVDFVGKHVNTQHYNKIRYINNYIMSSAGLATYKNAIWMVASFSDKLHLPPHVKERAAEIFKKIYYLTTNIHNSKNSVCACIYYACKEAHINRSMPDISVVAEEDMTYTSEIFKTFQKVVKMLKLDVPKNFTIDEEIAFMGSKLEFNESSIRLAVDMYKDVKARKKIYFGGKAPRIIASTLLYIAALITCFPVNQSTFYDSTNVTEYILKNRVKNNLRSKHFRKYREQIPREKLLTII